MCGNLEKGSEVRDYCDEWTAQWWLELYKKKSGNVKPSVLEKKSETKWQKM